MKPLRLRRRMRGAVHWSEVPERGDVGAMRFLLLVYRLLGRAAFTALLYPVVGYFYLTSPRARRASRDYLRRIERASAQGGRGDVRRLNPFRHLVEFGHAILDRAATWAGTFPLADIEFDDPAMLERFREPGQGALFIGSHLGNLEVLRAYVAAETGLKLNALMSTRNSPKLDRLLSSANSRAFERSIQIDSLSSDSLIKLQDKLHAGEHIAIAADRLSVNHRERSIEVPFLGDPASFPEGPFIIASLLACPVYLVFCLRSGTGYRVYIEPFANPLTLPRCDRRAALENVAAAYARRLEAHCLLAPTQWFNFFDFWARDDSKSGR